MKRKTSNLIYDLQNRAIEAVFITGQALITIYIATSMGWVS